MPSCSHHSIECDFCKEGRTDREKLLAQVERAGGWAAMAKLANEASRSRLTPEQVAARSAEREMLAALEASKPPFPPVVGRPDDFQPALTRIKRQPLTTANLSGCTAVEPRFVKPKRVYPAHVTEFFDLLQDARDGLNPGSTIGRLRTLMPHLESRHRKWAREAIALLRHQQYQQRPR